MYTENYVALAHYVVWGACCKWVFCMKAMERMRIKGKGNTPRMRMLRNELDEIESFLLDQERFSFWHQGNLKGHQILATLKLRWQKERLNMTFGSAIMKGGIDEEDTD